MSTYVIVDGTRITLRVNAMVANELARDYRDSHPGSSVRVVDSEAWDSPRGRARLLPGMSTLPVLSSR